MTRLVSTAAASTAAASTAAAGVWESKQALRKQVRGVLRSMPEEALAAASARACRRLLALQCVRDARSVCAYLEMPRGECKTGVLIEGLFEAGKTVFIPRVTGMDRADMKMLRVDSMEELLAFRRNKWGIPEPSDVEADAMEDALDGTCTLDLVVLPGVAFDRGCRRLGQGRGYYDTFLETASGAHALPPRTIGLGLQEQLARRCARRCA